MRTHRDLNYKFVALFAVIHGVTLCGLFAYVFVEGTRTSGSAALKIVEVMATVLALPVLLPIFYFTQDLGVITVLAFFVNSVIWGIVLAMFAKGLRYLLTQRARTIATEPPPRRI